MNTKSLSTAWAALFLLCAALGFFPEPENLLKALCILSGLLFFLPPFWMLRLARARGDRRIPALLRNLSLLSLGLTLMLLVLNFLSVGWSESAGLFVHALLAVVSAPMLCLRFWGLSLFLWALLMVCSVRAGKRA